MGDGGAHARSSPRGSVRVGGEAIDFDAGTVTVYQSLGRSKDVAALKGTKKGNTRALELPPPTWEALRIEEPKPRSVY